MEPTVSQTLDSQPLDMGPTASQTLDSRPPGMERPYSGTLDYQLMHGESETHNEIVGNLEFHLCNSGFSTFSSFIISF